MSEPINNLLRGLAPDQRRRIANALMADQFDRPTPQDEPVKERAGMFPLGTYANGQTGIAWPGFVAQPVESFVNLLQRGYQGGMGDTQGVEDAFNVAGGALVGGIASPKPVNALGIFGGRLAKTADQAALSRAEDMAARGVPREQIWNDTGWFKGVDGKWRFEIDDSRADFTGAQSGTLGDVMRHPDMFNAYPDMKGIEFYVRPGTGGNYSPSIYNRFEERTIPEAMTIGTDQKSVQPFSVGLHESQHALQHREGLAVGGGLEESVAPMKSIEAWRARLPAAIRAELEARNMPVRSFSSDPEIVALKDEMMQRIKDDSGQPFRWRSAFDGMDEFDIALEMQRSMSAEQLRKQSLNALRQTGYDTYNRLAGEVEARAVQQRMDMTPEQRRARFPWLDYDVPEADQIVRFSR